MSGLSLRVLNVLKGWLKTGFLALLLVTLSVGLCAAGVSRLPQGNAITDGKALLRYSLPIDNQQVRDLQESLEDISQQLRRKRWGAINGDLKKAARIVGDRQSDLLASVPDDQKPQAEALISQISESLDSLKAAAEAKSKPELLDQSSNVLNLVGELEEYMVGEFPFEVPAQYSNLPQLKGRATVKMTTEKGDLILVLDGYSAPVTAGNFVDLVQRGFYNGLPFTRAEESYVLQTGDPPGKEQGFIDPKTNEYRAIPLEILVQGDEAPTYGITLEQAGRYRDLPVLPFSAYGAVAMARPESEVNGGSSQFFFFLFEPELTPAGLNLLDGRYSIFGFVTEGKDVLGKLKQGDKIESATVIKGAENLVQPS
ncbi:peptidylprolyl isomerase [Aerosakkonemataceae cyanobacterium BLCC-F154]|uniref:peptidylprolyl isomerase n=1 Tax=Floridaenema fluviatile BLCC-F154 TaxID=3153640 RepID=A0ABV4Y9Q9_9CYAN